MERVPTRLAATAYLYCASCKKDFGQGKESVIGVRFVCPCDENPTDPSHIAAVVKDKPGRLWLRIEACILRYEKTFSPSRWLNSLKGRIGQYLTIRLVFLGFALAVARMAVQHVTGTPRADLLLMVLGIVIATGVILDTLLVNTSVAFFSRFPAHPLRTLVFAVLAFAQLAIAFAVYYALLGDQFEKRLSWVQAMYFSFTTITTVGYGDIHPKEDAWGAQLVIISELLVGLYFLAVIVTIFVGWATGGPKQPEYRSPEELRLADKPAPHS